MSVAVEPLTKDHIARLRFVGDGVTYNAVIPNYRKYIEHGAIENLSWAFVADGQVIGLFGVRPIWRGVAEAWMLPGVGLTQHATRLVRQGREVLRQIEIDHELVRLQAFVRVRNAQACKLARLMYFQKEGTCRLFGPDRQDYFIMARAHG